MGGETSIREPLSGKKGKKGRSFRTVRSRGGRERGGGWRPAPLGLRQRKREGKKILNHRNREGERRGTDPAHFCLKKKKEGKVNPPYQREEGYLRGGGAILLCAHLKKGEDVSYLPEGRSRIGSGCPLR